MLRSRLRSGSVDFGQKSHHHSSVFSKTLFASKLCRGDAIAAQIDASALKSVSNLSENVGVKGNKPVQQQQQMREMEEGSEVESLKKMVTAARDETKAKERKIGNLEAELGRMRQGEADKDASLGRLMKELRDVRERENANKKRIQELEGEVERKRKAESSMARQLDSAMFELEESKIEIASLHEKIDGLEDLCNQMSKGGSSGDEEIRSLKAKLGKAQEGERRALLKAESLAEEMEVLKGEWKFAMEGEDKSSKAMEDLALALKEVATESNQVKMQLEEMKAETERMKEEVAEAKQDAEVHKNTAERLRSEAEETLFAWNAKEIGFVSCIKRAEEERALAQIENHKLAESLKAAENMTRSAREETYKLRDILKQAINESNAAKAAAGIARDENSLLKDCLAEKEEALHFITRENERLRISEAAAQEHVKQLKRMLTMASAEIDKDEIGIVMFTEHSDDDDGEQQPRKVRREFSFDLDDLKFMNEPEDDTLDDEDPEKAEALKGSIFDTTAETPKSEARTPKATFFRLKTHSSHDDKEDDHDHDHGHDETEGDKQHSGHRRSKTMFQRVGGLLTIRKSFHRKEPSMDQKSTPTPTHGN
ncbi:WEB family protein At4g27595, chloroplastic [Salvia miltiorrhiza]|uniref:WEB family protein At4g27595, chloroplastic n=1 Tax=Salvia miltiorrhiza TaxID=226208 RepID=UPI0025AC8BA1|nr:WEB family protein At4g27595, chloroplastic [Salvia miltiorrhiza]